MQNGELLVWTDGSCTNGAAGLGVFFGQDNGANLAARAVGDQTSNNAERQAALHALEATLEEEKICIITDNESMQLLLQGAVAGRPKARRAVEHCIVALVRLRAEKGYSTRCEHVYSHLPEKMHTHKMDEAWQAHLRKQKAMWGTAFRIIVKGNEEADRLAARGAAMPPPVQYSRVQEQHLDLGVYLKGRWTDERL